MSWVKLDDGFYFHPKRWMLDIDAIGLWVLCLCYAGHQLTDGFVPKEFIQANTPKPDRRGTLKALLATEMLAEVEGGYEIHSYLDYNPSREQVLSNREKRAASGRRGAQVTNAKKVGKKVGTLPNGLPSIDRGKMVGDDLAPLPGKQHSPRNLSGGSSLSAGASSPPLTYGFSSGEDEAA